MKTENSLVIGLLDEFIVPDEAPMWQLYPYVTGHFLVIL